jgi:hypothetical protein
VEIQALSLGEALNVTACARGAVHSVFTRAVNLNVAGNLWTLLAESLADMPYGLRLRLSDFDALDLKVGQPVNVRSQYVGIGVGRSLHLVVDCRTATRSVPIKPNRIEPGLWRRLALVDSMIRGRAWTGAEGLAQTVVAALNEPSRLAAVLGRVIGRGPGLTPSGDDVVIGILAVLRAPAAASANPAAVDCLTHAIAPLLPTTTSISGHLLRQACDGLFSRPLQDLVAALRTDATAQHLEQRVERLVAMGATSGADSGIGLLAAAPLVLLPPDKRVAA